MGVVHAVQRFFERLSWQGRRVQNVWYRLKSMVGK